MVIENGRFIRASAESRKRRNHRHHYGRRPRRFRAVQKVYIRGITVSMPGNIQPYAYVCIGFRDHIVHRMEFDDHAVRQRNWNDTDDCAC